MTGMLAGAAVAVLALGCGIWWIRTRIVLVTVDGPSMEPTLHDADRVVVRRLPADRLRVGQIVVLVAPYHHDGWVWPTEGTAARPTRWVIKRLAALPGEPVPAGVAGSPPETVPPGRAVVFGDNAGGSVDSRTYGLVPLARVLGVAIRHYDKDASLAR